jgi:flagellar basal-body rod modification protein FlgD
MSAVGSTGSALTGSTAAATSDSLSQISSSQFMQLLLAQLQNQNPLDPISNTDFATQLAQFSQLDSLNTLNSNFSNLLLVQQFSGASNLIGKLVSYTPTNSATALSGTVDSLSVQNGTVDLNINGTNVPLSQVNSIS